MTSEGWTLVLATPPQNGRETLHAENEANAHRQELGPDPVPVLLLTDPIELIRGVAGLLRHTSAMNLAQGLETTIIPTGATAIWANLMCCRPKGIPTTVRKLAKAEVRSPVASYQAATRNQITFPSVPKEPVSQSRQPVRAWREIAS